MNNLLSCLFGHHKYTIDVSNIKTSALFSGLRKEHHFLCEICKRSEYRWSTQQRDKYWIDYDENMLEIRWHDNCGQAYERDKEGHWVNV
jgi:hypothetical protein